MLKHNLRANPALGGIAPTNGANKTVSIGAPEAENVAEKSALLLGSRWPSKHDDRPKTGRLVSEKRVVKCGKEDSNLHGL